MAQARGKKDGGGEIVKAAFGAKNRSRLIDIYFEGQREADITPRNAWAHVYRLLLWADQTNGLAHCYESDKSQPGKNWYARSLAFHDWVSKSLNSEPNKLAEGIDWLFRRATADLAAEVMRSAERVAAAAARQREPYEGKNFPKPGEDPELVAIVKEVLGDALGKEPSEECWQALVQRIRQYLALENKRKNLVGEGFEDVLAAVVQRTCRPDAGVTVHPRHLLHDLPGFNRVRRGEKPNKVDVAVLRAEMRTLVTAKWSVRADREKQFTADYNDYVSAESDGKPFEYVFVTNEFDPARLMRACEKLAMNAPMFTHVVHISTDALKATYGEGAEETMRKVVDYIDSGRLISLEQWLMQLGRLA
ncbi:MAG: hypothetical protein KDC98_12960 [Planctomycetes bacterium]|nr:hypothetical protein [Planctomycetota bacterium]